MSNSPSIAVLILAAGESSRLGRPKQLLKWKNTTLLGHVIETAKVLNQCKLAIVLGANAEHIKSKIENYTVDVLEHLNWKKGLGSSIAFGVKCLLKENSNYDGILIILGDQPLIDSGYLNTMIKQFEIGKGQIIATSYDHKKNGVPVLFDQVYFHELSQLNDDKGAKQMLLQYEDKVISVISEGLVSDIDTLEDYEKLYKFNHQ